MGWHYVVCIGVRVNANTGSAWRMPSRDTTRRWRELIRVFGIDTALDRVAFYLNVALANGQFFAIGNANLLLNNIDACDHFGYWVFNLNTGIHFNEVKLAVFK